MNSEDDLESAYLEVIRESQLHLAASRGAAENSSDAQRVLEALESLGHKSTPRWSLLRRRFAGRPRQPLRGLIRFADLFGLHSRRAIKELAGDYAVEVKRLRRERRYGMARWNSFLAWCYAGWYVLQAPVAWAVQVARKMLKGNSAGRAGTAGASSSDPTSRT